MIEINGEYGSAKIYTDIVEEEAIAQVVSRLRICKEMCEVTKFKEAEKLLTQAADAIEELSKRVDESIPKEDG